MTLGKISKNQLIRKIFVVYILINFILGSDLKIYIICWSGFVCGWMIKTKSCGNVKTIFVGYMLSRMTINDKKYPRKRSMNYSEDIYTTIEYSFPYIYWQNPLFIFPTCFHSLFIFSMSPFCSVYICTVSPPCTIFYKDFTVLTILILVYYPNVFVLNSRTGSSFTSINHLTWCGGGRYICPICNKKLLIHMYAFTCNLCS